jgi:hypothetical protein
MGHRYSVSASNVCAHRWHTVAERQAAVGLIAWVQPFRISNMASAAVWHDVVFELRPVRDGRGDSRCVVR